MSTTGQPVVSKFVCPRCSESVPSLQRGAHRRLCPRAKRTRRQPTPEFFTCGCGQAVSKYSKWQHKLSCVLEGGAVRRTDAQYAQTLRVCVFAGCGVEYRPRAQTQRYCSASCRLKDGKRMDETAREESFLVPLKRVEEETERKAREAGEALLARRARAWNSWVTCLGLPEDMKEAI